MRQCAEEEGRHAEMEEEKRFTLEEKHRTSDMVLSVSPKNNLF